MRVDGEATRATIKYTIWETSAKWREKSSFRRSCAAPLSGSHYVTSRRGRGRFSLSLSLRPIQYYTV